MHPILFTIGDKITIYSYGFMIALGMITCVLVAYLRAGKRYATDPDIIFNVCRRGAFSLKVDEIIVAFTLVVDLVSKSALTPIIDLLNAAAESLDKSLYALCLGL